MLNPACRRTMIGKSRVSGGSSSRDAMIGKTHVLGGSFPRHTMIGKSCVSGGSSPWLPTVHADAEDCLPAGAAWLCGLESQPADVTCGCCCRRVSLPGCVPVSTQDVVYFVVVVVVVPS